MGTLALHEGTGSLPTERKAGRRPGGVLSHEGGQQFRQCDCVSFSNVQEEGAPNSEVSQGASGELECRNHGHGEEVTETT